MSVSIKRNTFKQLFYSKTPGGQCAKQKKIYKKFKKVQKNKVKTHGTIEAYRLTDISHIRPV